ncbi:MULTISPECIES: hypothetical protein [unclassified Saccharicrinis]|uniref:hypothetical protein n=1 Tax=unclassified Saccharicrinis TaxID=2646859 RepID=UPI003D32D5F1
MEDKEKYNEEDRLVRELFDSFSPSAPSKGFIKGTMNAVLQEWSSQPIFMNTGMSVKNKIWISISSVLAVVLVYFVDVKQMGGEKSWFGVDAFKESLIQLMGSSLAAFESIPTLVYMVAIGLALLLVVDKMINKLVNN